MVASTNNVNLGRYIINIIACDKLFPVMFLDQVTKIRHSFVYLYILVTRYKSIAHIIACWIYLKKKSR